MLTKEQLKNITIGQRVHVSRNNRRETTIKENFIVKIGSKYFYTAEDESDRVRYKFERSTGVYADESYGSYPELFITESDLKDSLEMKEKWGTVRNIITCTYSPPEHITLDDVNVILRILQGSN